MKEDKRKSGLVCSYKDCKNKSYSDGANSFYRFPEDVERAKSWLQACCRPDLLKKLDALHKSYRICDAHFSPRMFRKGKRKILQKDAVPVTFVSIESNIDEPVPSTSTSSTETSRASILYKLLMESSASTISKSSDRVEMTRRSPIHPSRSVQTSEKLIFQSPKWVKLRKINNALKLENKALKRKNSVLLNKCKNLERKLHDILDDTITPEQCKRVRISIKRKSLLKSS